MEARLGWDRGDPLGPRLTGGGRALGSIPAWVAAATLVGCAPDGRPETDATASATAGSADDPEWVVFGSARSGEGDLYAVLPETGELRTVVATPAPEGTVRWDPARRRLVHHRFDDDAAMLVSEGRDLFTDPNGDVAPAWGPDGRVVYALESEGGGDLWIADSLGRDPRRLTSDAAVERYPAWSPRGDRIVYAKRLEAGWDLFALTVGSDGTPGVAGEERLTDDGTYVGHPAWSPDGGRIAFDTFVGDQTEIVVLDLASGAVEQVTRRAGNDLIPAWSADGSRLVFGGETEPGNFDVWLVDLASGELQRLTSDPAGDGGPLFVPASAVPGG